MNEPVPDDVQRFLSQVESIWSMYLEHGPGSVDRSHFEALQATSRVMCASIQPHGDLTESVSQLEGLCKQIACTPQGLSFISGEAGLVPRRDLHDRFVRNLDVLRAACCT